MSFFLYLLYLVATFIRIDIILPDLVPYRPMLWLMLLCLGSALIGVLGSREVSARPRHFLLLGSFVAAIGASQVVNGWTGGAVQAVADFLPSAVIAILTWLNVTTLRRLKLACGVVVVSMLCLSIAGILSFHTGFMEDKFILHQTGGDDESASMPEKIEADSEVDNDPVSGGFLRLRGIGFLADPNDFAQAIVLVLPLLWARYVRKQPVRTFLLLMVPTLAFLYAIFLTHSRGALVGLAALLFFGVRKRLGTVKTVLLIAILVVGAQATNFSGGRDMSTQEESAGDRIDSWDKGIHLLAQRPLLGVGYGNYTNFNELTAHNSFVLCFTELGLVGLFIWIGILVQAYKSVNYLATTAPPQSPEHIWGYSLRSALIGFLACAWFLSRTYEPLLYLLAAMCIAAAYCRKEAEPKAAAVSLLPAFPWAKTTAMACLVAIMAVYATIIMQRVMGH
ncbi:MAG: O-antigen ligase family protein [Burkholderiaceae bacterium]